MKMILSPGLGDDLMMCMLWRAPATDIHRAKDSDPSQVIKT